MLSNSEFQEFNTIKEQYGNNAIIKASTIEFSNHRFFNDFKNKVRKERRGEVAFCVKRLNGRYVVVRTSYYPFGVYRVPTGGINFGENILDALFREVKEELGVVVEIEEFLGAVDYSIRYHQEKLDFCSYVFLLKEISGNILKDALENEIEEYREVNKKELKCIVNTLKSHCGNWKDWCSFRAETTGFILPLI